ncbi:MAG: hypothetical protein JSV88_13445 [Candidatus Aminicenantes bacterium]|nr:MAG: hypothetical protein JSV88_13445 [Candidatus Aminicenantes bacterium]
MKISIEKLKNFEYSCSVFDQKAQTQMKTEKEKIEKGRKRKGARQKNLK